MGLWTTIRRAFWSEEKPARVPLGPIRGRYDAYSGTTNANHWLNADALDADAANSLTVRRKIARHARYEVGNNGQGKGVQLTHANYVIGRGPKLRVQSPDPAQNAKVEAAWVRWCKRVKFARKLRTAVKAKVCDGEAFLQVIDNPRIAEVALDVRGIECEQVSSPYLPFSEPGYIDGIRFDEAGNPLWYDVLKQHPGGLFTAYGQQADRVPARFMFHLFRGDRPGEHRAVSELSPTLNLFAQSRRYREATVAAAENIANWSILLKTQQMPNDGGDTVTAMSSYPMEKGMMVGLPGGYDAFQPKAEQPSATYESFTRSNTCEQARPLNMPYNIAAADSSGYSFSGGRLDHLTYFVSVDVEQADIEDLVLDPLFDLWWSIAAPRIGWTPYDQTPPHTWDWPAKPDIQPVDTANARKTDLSTGTTHRRRIAAEDGYDLDDEDSQAAADLGMTVEEYRREFFRVALAGGSTPAREPDSGDEPPMPPRNRLSKSNGKVRV